MAWQPCDYLREHLHLDYKSSQAIVDLFEQDNTVPFIARYRKDVTGGLDAAQVRRAKEKWEQSKTLLARIQSVKNQLESRQQLTPALNRSLCESRCLDDVETIYAPFKPSGVKTLAGRARAAGLEQPCLDILAGRRVELQRFVGQAKGISSLPEVESAVVHLVADLIFHNKAVRDYVATLLEDRNIRLQSARSAASVKLDSEKSGKLQKNGPKKQAKDVNNKVSTNAHIYEKYFEFSMPAAFVKNYAVSAINRGEAHKILSVKVTLPDYLAPRVKQRIGAILGGPIHAAHKLVFEKAVEDCINRQIKPYMQRHVRSRLTQNAHQEAIEMFARNLKQLLLTPPLKGEVIMGIDPGYRHGCKVAVINRSGAVLDTDVVYLPEDSKNIRANETFQSKLKDLILKHECARIAIGNGSGCRLTEQLVSGLIGSGALRPLTTAKSVGYVIVNESGSSVYSASELAAKELPNLDEKLRSAVSIARRMQDPISEFVKIDPKSLGVGQYQHDVKEKLLQNSLDGVVEECVSFVGVDINTCSEHLLRYVAGMNATRAKKVIEFREKSSKNSVGISNRQQLLGISGIGAKVFEQAAGFIRIFPDSDMSGSNADASGSESLKKGAGNGKVKLGKRKHPTSLDYDLLDSTIVHPESYSIAETLLDRLGLTKGHIGNSIIRTSWTDYLQRHSIETISAELNGSSREKLELIVDGLSQPKHADYRDSFEKPYFRQTIRSITDLRLGQTLPGVVRNVTGFGAFVDVGVGDDGLVPLRYMNGDVTALSVGQNVTVEVMSMELERKRYALKWRSDL